MDNSCWLDVEGHDPKGQSLSYVLTDSKDLQPVGFYVIPPYEFKIPDDILYTNVPADAGYDAWSSAQTYNIGDVATTPGKVWVSQFARVVPLDQTSGLPSLYNEGIDPEGANQVGLKNDGSFIPNRLGYTNLGQAWWVDVTDDPYFANRYRMFSDSASQVTEHPDKIEVEVRPQEPWNVAALLNVAADFVFLWLENGPEDWHRLVDLRYENPISPEFPNVTDIAFVDIPLVDPALYPSAKLTVHLVSNPARVNHIGMLAVGLSSKIGLTTYESQVEIIDFSRKDRDTFGEIIVIERGWSALARMKFELDTVEIAEVRDFLASRRAKPTVYVGVANRAELIVLGFYRDFNLTASDFQNSEGVIEVESFVSDRPANLLLPARAVFIDINGTQCIDSDLGATATLCLNQENDRPIGQVNISILNRPTAPGEIVTWEMTWLSGSSGLESGSWTLFTDCGQALPVFTWPLPPLSAQVPGTAAIRAKILLPDLTEIVTEPAILNLDYCEEPCVTDCQFSLESVGWHDTDIDQYSKTTEEASLSETCEILRLTSRDCVNFSVGSGISYLYYPVVWNQTRVDLWFNPGTIGSPVMYAYHKTECTQGLLDTSAQSSRNGLSLSFSLFDIPHDGYVMIAVTGDEVWGGEFCIQAYIHVAGN